MKTSFQTERCIWGEAGGQQDCREAWPQVAIKRKSNAFFCLLIRINFV